MFWESTGLNGQSTVREVDVESGKVLRRKQLPAVGASGVTAHRTPCTACLWTALLVQRVGLQHQTCQVGRCTRQLFSPSPYVHPAQTRSQTLARA